MEKNALERLVQKQKPTVSPRLDVVTASVNSDAKTDLSQSYQTRLNIDTKTPDTLDVKTNLSQEFQTKVNPDEFETVRNTIRIESSVDEALRKLCHAERITKETWLEAAYLVLSQHPDQLTEVVRLAEERLQQRKAIANYKRAETMQEKFLRSKGLISSPP